MNMPRPTRLALIIFILSLSGCLTGCLSGLRGEVTPIQVVSPNVRIEVDPSWPTVDLALNVRRPQGSQMLDGFGLLVRQDDHRLMTWSGLAWADTTVDMLQSELIKGLRDSRRLTGGVARPGEIRANGTLMSNIRHFELVDEGAGGRHIRLEVSAMLTRNRDARQVASENFLVIQPVSTADTAVMLEAYEVAITDLVQQMIGWTLKMAQAQKDELEAVGLN